MPSESLGCPHGYKVRHKQSANRSKGESKCYEGDQQESFGDIDLWSNGNNILTSAATKLALW